MTRSLAGKFETGESSPAIPHMNFIDGMRGLAAVYVVLNHAAQLAFPINHLPPSLFFLGWGRAAVTVFIAISGYCLALPVVRSDFNLRGGTAHFYKKRAWRILPPYFVALAIGIAFNVAANPAGHRMEFFADPLNRKAILAHVFLVHNFFPDVAYMLDGPLWSVAAEVQIYLLFPIIVVVWRRFGVSWMLAGSLIFAHLLLYLAGHRGSVNYLFIFTLGAAAAEFSLKKVRPIAFKWIFGASSVVFLLVHPARDFLGDLIVGIAASSLMVVCGRAQFWLGRVLSWRILTWLGSFSYSIYLIHNLVQHFYFSFPGLVFHVSPGRPLFVLIALGYTPVALAVSYAFHWLVERPFMTVHKSLAAGKLAQPRKAQPVA